MLRALLPKDYPWYKADRGKRETVCPSFEKELS